MFCYGIEESEVPDMKICELDCEMLDQWVARSLGIDLEFLGKPFMPSTLWEHGGPIIEGAGISLLSTKVSPCNDWQAGMGHPDLGQGWGPTPLVAAMRCFLASQYGDELPVSDADEGPPEHEEAQTAANGPLWDDSRLSTRLLWR